MRTTLIAAQSLDGFITRHAQPGTAFTSVADKSHFSAELRGYDCSVVGGETYRVAREFIRKQMQPGRRRMVLTRSPAVWARDAVPGVLEFTQASPPALLAQLAAAGHQRCALLGGAQIHQLFLEAGCVDELCLTVEPRLFGQGTPLILASLDVSLRLLSSERLPDSESLVLRYEVIR